jgi:bifunctional DNase/RNase
MSAGPSTTFVILVLLACAAGAFCRFVTPLAPDGPVEMRAQELVRVSGGQPILVLVEKQGLRRLGIPVTRAEAALIDSALRGSRGLGTATIEALGGRVLRASIDGAVSAREFRGHLSLGSGGQELRLESSAGEAISIALQAGAAIVADEAVLEEAGVSPEELRGRTARNLRVEIAPAPVLDI